MKEILSKLTKFKAAKTLGPKEQCGLDIGTYSVKSCVASIGADKTELLAYANITIENSDTNSAVKKALDIVKWQTKAVNISSGIQGSVTRQIVFPKMTPDELKDALKFEVEKYIPYKLDQVILDFQILKQEIEPNKILVLIAAAKKEIIEKRIALAKELGLKIEAIDVDTLSLNNAFNFLFQQDIQKQKCCALIHIGNSATSVIILKDELPYVIRDIFIAGKDLNKGIADNLNIEPSDAENIKVNPGQKQNEVIAACETIINELCSQIRMSFDYCENQYGAAVEKIYLSGGSSRFSGLNKLFENYFGIQVVIWDNLSNLKINSNVDEKNFMQDLGALNISLGLALR